MEISAPASAHQTVDGALRAAKGCTSLKVRRLSRRISQHFDRTLAEVGLKTTQYSLLSHVVELGPVAPGVLARLMDLNASTLTRNLQPLVSAGWLQVEPGSDQRSRWVVATPAGSAKRNEARRVWKRAQLALNQRLGAAAVARLHAAADECLSLLDEHE